MKNFATLLIMLISAVAFSQEKKTEKAVIKTAIYCDHCKECETCGKQFNAGLLKINGVKMVEVDETDMTITVYYNPQKTELQAIKTAIAKSGYDADELKADPDAYEKLDGCCKRI
ncbi:MAG TPA: cation transporter [Flavobacterium sp.]|jgi:copper chaperone CopZ